MNDETRQAILEAGYEPDDPCVRECPRCEGGGRLMECYGGPPVETICERCCGLGWVDDVDVDEPTRTCDCGARHTSTPDQHYDWCPVSVRVP